MAANKTHLLAPFRIGHASGPAPEQQNRRITMSAASLLTLVAISCASLGLWRMGTDLDWAGDFVFQSGFLSHWQVWIGSAVGVQYTSWRLTRYAGTHVQARSADHTGGGALKPADAV